MKQEEQLFWKFGKNFSRGTVLFHEGDPGHERAAPGAVCSPPIRFRGRRPACAMEWRPPWSPCGGADRCICYLMFFLWSAASLVTLGSRSQSAQLCS
jgi:hypothetical protein